VVVAAVRQTFQRVLFEGLMAYKRRVETDRLTAPDELAAQVQDLGVSY
jgi:hypothetical protein